MGLKDRQGSRGGDCGGLRGLGRRWGDRAGGWRLAGTGIGLKDRHGGEVGERVNGFLAGVLDGRGVVERGAEAEEVCHHGDRGGRLPLALHLIEIALHPLEIAPKKLLLLEYVHRKVVLPLG